MKTKKNKLKLTILAYAAIFVILYIIIYIVPRVSGIFLETYTAEYGLLEVSAESTFVTVRDERLCTADNSGTVSRIVSQGKLMRRSSHIVDVGGIKHYSPQKGIISYYYDGLEAVYTPENMQSITEETAAKIKEKAEEYKVRECEANSVQAGQPIFKVVDNNEWYLVCWLEAAEAAGCDPGKSITAEFSDGQQIKMKVLQSNAQGEKTQLILSCNRYYEKFDRIRTGTCRLIKSSRSGIILESDSIVEEDGVKGVYVMSKRLDKASFVPVSILLTDGEKTVVEKNYFMDGKGEKVVTVKNYDEILKKPETAETTKGSEKNAD